MEILNRTLDLNLILVKVFLFVTGISAVFRRTISIKLSLSRPYIAIHKFDVVCLSETYLNASISNDDDSLEVSSYNLFRADRPSNGCFCIYCRNSLPFKILGIHNLQECIDFKIIIGVKLHKFVSLYRSPNQSQDYFESFANNFELNNDAVTANNLFLTVGLGR